MKLIRSDDMDPRPKEFDVFDGSPLQILFTVSRLDHVELHYTDGIVTWSRPTSHLHSTRNSAHRR